MKSLILIEDKAQLDIFFDKYHDKYVPVVYDIACQTLLERRGEEFISINSELDYDEVLGIYRKASDLGERFIAKLDIINEENFYNIFGARNLELFRITTKYLFTYSFLSNLFHALAGLGRILKKYSPCALYYFPFDIDRDIFSSTKSVDYFCPKRILPFFISAFSGEEIRCIELNHKIAYEEIAFSWNLKKRIKRLICRSILRKELPDSNAHVDGRNLLVLTSAYQLRPAIENLHPLNKLLKRLCEDDFYVISKKGDRVSLEMGNSLSSLENRPSGKIKKDVKLLFSFEKFSEPELKSEIFKRILIIVEKFIEKNMDSVIVMWEGIKRLDAVYNFESLLWDNPPIIDTKKGIISEYFRSNKKPRIGIQHGGGFGYKLQDNSHFDCEYKHCEYYFGYGYSSEDLIKLFPRREVKTRVLSKGPCEADFIPQRNHREKKGIKIIYPFPYNFENPFFRLARPNRIDEFLFDFQKKILNRLTRHNTKEIMLKFPPGNFRDHAIKFYIDGLKHSFITRSEPFSEVLKDYSAEYILIDVVSTPLDQSLLYNSNLLIYDNPCAPLTEDAFKLLSKRAVVTKERDVFLGYIDAIFNGTFPGREIYNNEYLLKYAKQPCFRDAESLNDFFNLAGINNFMDKDSR